VEEAETGAAEKERLTRQVDTGRDYMEIPEDRAERIVLLAVSGPVIGFGIRLGRPKSERPMNLQGQLEIWNNYETYNASLGSVALLLRAIVEAPTTLPDVLKIGDTVTDTRICWPSFVIRVVS
jgi:hypothetical protein